MNFSSLPHPILAVDRHIALDSSFRSLVLCGPPIAAARTILELYPLPDIVSALDRLSRPEHATALARGRALEVARLLPTFVNDLSRSLSFDDAA